MKFQVIASNFSWNDNALYSQFYDDLKKTIKNELIKNLLKTLHQFIITITRIDNCQYKD